MKDNDKSNNFIKNAGIRLTPQREEIFRIFSDNNNKHLSAFDIYKILQEDNKTIGISTIYRTLDLFVEKNIIIKRDFDYESARYEFVHREKEQHYHLICEKCGKIIEIEDFLPSNITEKVMEEKGFQLNRLCLKIYGYCKKCRTDSSFQGSKSNIAN